MTMKIPRDPKTLLRRRPLAEALTEEGYPIAEATLATKATRGNSPPFRKFGRVPLYEWGPALDWARSQLSPPMGSTSEQGAAKQPTGIARASDPAGRRGA